ncbi:hypothetical protein BDY21DRAFT_337905 [Lineolata rhizophorae]|uniref:Uncharacterized protein n=1 Tax=Lineolata rhizophorae TaxID=578093 RepID=A0A6A6P644_9PEZI|nr:hypothetical protein BDY21DRAFT_337905 [Lineolata rhizophorae]
MDLAASGSGSGAGSAFGRCPLHGLVRGRIFLPTALGLGDDEQLVLKYLPPRAGVGDFVVDEADGDVVEAARAEEEGADEADETDGREDESKSESGSGAAAEAAARAAADEALLLKWNRPDASWRRMLLTQPPVRTAKLLVPGSEGTGGTFVKGRAEGKACRVGGRESVVVNVGQVGSDEMAGKSDEDEEAPLRAVDVVGAALNRKVHEDEECQGKMDPGREGGGFCRCGFGKNVAVKS